MTEPRHRRSVKGLLDSLTAVANKCEKELGASSSNVDGLRTRANVLWELTAVANKCEKELGASSSNVDGLRTRANVLWELLKETQAKHDAAHSELRNALELHNTRASQAELMRELIKLFDVEGPKGE